MDALSGNPPDPRGTGNRPTADGAASATAASPRVLGLGDVHEVIRWALVVACVLDAVSEATLGSTHSPRNAAIAVISAVALVVNRRIGAAITAMGLLFTLHTSHEFLVFSVAAILAVFPSPRQLILLVRVQLTALWLFAGIAKLEPGFRTGVILESGHVFLLDALPTSVLVWGSILTEAVVLPLLLWTRPRLVLWFALAFQSLLLMGMSTYRSGRSLSFQISYETALWSFGLLTMACVIAVTTSDIRNANRTETATAAVA